MGFREEKVASTIKKVLWQPVSDFAREKNAGLVTITEVKMSPDLSIAKVYVSVYGGKLSPQTFINLLDEDKSKLRRLIASNLRLRLIPELRFYYDDSLDKIEHIEKLLEKAKSGKTDTKVN